MLGHGEVGSQQQSYSYLYTSRVLCSYNKIECVQYTIIFTLINFVNKGATPDEPHKNAACAFHKHLKNHLVEFSQCDV
jgi:hypothetical protein